MKPPMLPGDGSPVESAVDMPEIMGWQGGGINDNAQATDHPTIDRHVI